MDFLASFTGLDLPGWAWTIVLTAGAGIGIAKTAVPGSAILVVVLMAMALPARMSVGVLLPMLILGDVFAVGKFWKHTDRRQLFTLLPFAFLGLGAGYLILRHVTNEQLKPIIGGVVLFMLGVHQVSRMVKNKSAGVPGEGYGRVHPFLKVLFGFAGGLGTGMANSAGPIMSLYFLIAGFPKLPFIATAAWFFFTMNLLKVPLFLNLGLISGQSLRVNLLTIPSVALGALLGYWIISRISQEKFNRAVLVLAFVAALRLVF